MCGFKHLLALGACTITKSKKFDCPLAFAVSLTEPDLLAAIIEHENKKQESSLTTSIFMGAFTSIKKSSNKKQALQCASNLLHHHQAKELIDSGFRTNERQNIGQTFFHDIMNIVGDDESDEAMELAKTALCIQQKSISPIISSTFTIAIKYGNPRLIKVIGEILKKK